MNFTVPCIGSGLLTFDFNGKVRTPVLAHATADTGIRVGRIGNAVLIERQNLLGTKMHANPAPLAPVAFYMMGL
jgi:hypothetical protein